MTVAEMASILELMKKSFEFSATSWFRSPKRNAKVGGNPKSKHLIGLGVDVIPDDWSILGAFTALANVHDLSVLDEGDHWHIQPRAGNRRR